MLAHWFLASIKAQKNSEACSSKLRKSVARAKGRWWNWDVVSTPVMARKSVGRVNEMMIEFKILAELR